MQMIFWDNDGVLVNTEPLYFECNQQFCRPLGLELTEQQFADCFLRDSPGFWHLLPQRYSPAEIQQLRKARDQQYHQLLSQQQIKAQAGIEALLNALPNCRHAIVTSAHRDHFALIHQHSDLLHHFDYAICGDECRAAKPDPSGYLQALERSGLTSADIVVVEDSPRGLAAAQAAGLRCIVLRHPLTAAESFTGAMAVVDSVAELSALLQSLQQN